MRWSEIEWTKHDLMPSHQARVKVGEYTLSIITESQILLCTSVLFLLTVCLYRYQEYILKKSGVTMCSDF